MKSGTLKLSVVLVSMLLTVGQAAQQAPLVGHADHGADAQDAEQRYREPVLPEGVTLDEALGNAAKPSPASWSVPVADNAIFSFTLFELLEYRVSDTGRDEFGWDTQGWIGNDDHKFWWKTEGDTVFDVANSGDVDVQALYATPISAFWYFQVGIRYEQAWEPGRTDGRFSAVLGAQGLAPYEFDVEPALYLTDDGDVLGQLTASYDLYVTQRWVLQPRVELFASAQNVPASRLGSGVNNGSFDLRLRYEIRREFAPYVGISYRRLFGETADMAARNGQEDHDLLLLSGVRIVF